MRKGWIVATAAVLGGLAVASTASQATPSTTAADTYIASATNSSGNIACDALVNAGLGDRLLFPTDSGYEPQISTWWCVNGRFRPSCLVLPQNTGEVSTALTALVGINKGAGDWHIAVRSGGHSWPGSNNIANGVTIDLSMMNASIYDAQANVAKIEPGGRWKDVFASLGRQGVVVAGGRDGGVGVGGFLLGGGISFYSGRMGFACDSVVNYEVVLADGSVVHANRSANTDLWRALKGGGSNFGIVTRFDMETLPAKNLSYNIRFMSSNYSDTIIDAIVGFSNQDQSLADDHMFALWSHNSTISPGVYVAAVHVNIQGNVNSSTAFDKVKALPALLDRTTLESMTAAADGSQVPSSGSIAGSTLTFRNDLRILRRAVDLHAELVETLKQHISPDKFKTSLVLQPIPSYLAVIGQQRGGNMMGLDRVHYNAVMWTADVMVDGDDAAFALAQAELNIMRAQVKKASLEMQGDMNFLYMNYADASQDPIGTYGSANIEHIRGVATRYDPTGVFQTRVPGGFKISRVV